MPIRPLARRAGSEGFATFFHELAPRPASAAPLAAAEARAGRPLDIGLDFSFLPRRREARDGRVTLACLLHSAAAQETAFSLGTFRGARWRCGTATGATPPEGAAPDLAAGTGSVALAAGVNVFELELEAAAASALACLRFGPTPSALGVEVPEGVPLDSDAGATPEFRLLNRPGDLEPRPGVHYAEWRRELAKRWKRLLGAVPKGRGALRVLEETDAGDHLRALVSVRTPAGNELPGHLLAPKDLKRKAPGVLAIHGHGPGRGRVIGLEASEGQRDYGLLLVRRGYVVLAPDIRNFGERADPLAAAERYRRDPCDVQFLRGYATGALPARTEALEWRAWLDALAAHPRVNARRLGVLGLSLGGRTTGLLAALDTRVKAAVVSGALNTLRERVLYGQGCVKYLLPGLLAHADLPEQYALAAPRALFFELGTDDSTSPEVFAQEAYRRMETVYAAAGAPEALECHVFDGGHYFNGTRSLDWLDGRLRK